MLKQEIETQILPDMEERLNNKIDAIHKIVENKKVKNHRQQKSSSNISLAHPIALSHHQTVKQKESNIILT